MEEVGENVNRQFRGSNERFPNKREVSVDTRDRSIGSAANRKMKDSMESSFFPLRTFEDGHRVVEDTWKILENTD